MFCPNCGNNVGEGNFCPNCGTPINKGNTQTPPNQSGFNDQLEKTADGLKKKVVDTFTEMTGGNSDDIKFSLNDLWCDVFKKHTSEESDSLLISGTSHTTPSLRELCTTWNRPWLYSRVFIVLLITFALLTACTYLFQNIIAIPGVMFIGAMVIPFTLLVLFWETNIPKNISIFKLVTIFFIGGVASIIFSLILFTIFPVEQLDYIGATVTGIVEEVGKLAIVFILIKQLDCKYILNGILIGATVGAGFAAFESAGYALAYGNDINGILEVTVMRAILSPGGHIVWAAISGAAVMFAKGDEKLNFGVFKSAKFWRLFPVPVVLHAVWDMPIPLSPYLMYGGLILIAWVFILALLRSGMSQVSRLCIIAASESTTENSYESH